MYVCPYCDGGLRLAAKPPHVINEGLLTPAAILGPFVGAHWSRHTPECAKRAAVEQSVASGSNWPGA